VVISRARAPRPRSCAARWREARVRFVFPALAIEDAAPSRGRTPLARLARYALAIFVSANAVEKGLAPATRARPVARAVPVAAIGEATAQALRNSRLRSGDLTRGAPRQRRPPRPARMRQVAGGSRDLPRRGRPRAAEGGARAARRARDYAECYRRVRPHAIPRRCWRVARGEIAAVSALSAETLENFVAMLGEAEARHLADALVVPHAAIAAHRDARRFGARGGRGHGAEASVDRALPA
jgi:uroporphyrinogen-III synthase